MDEIVYVVTDIETDGPWPGPNSMRSFASVAVTPSGRVLGEFEGVLEPLPGAAPNPDTLAWFRSQPPEVWAATTEGARPAAEVLDAWCTWVRGLGVRRAFAAHPLAFDGTWFDHYLRRFTAYGLAQGPYERERLFTDVALCLASYLAGMRGRVPGDHPWPLPDAWLGHVEHTHRAIDDARGYAHLLTHLFAQPTPERIHLDE